MMLAKKLFLTCLLAGAALSQTACSNSSWVTGVDLGTVDRNGEQFVEVSATLNTQGLTLISFTAPIVDPKDPTHLIGEVSLQNGLVAGTAELSVLISQSAIPGLPAMGQGLLPNGSAIPIAGANASKWITIAVSSKSRFYLNIDLATKTFILGTAFNIDALTMGVPATVLIPFQSNGISGAAGVYSGVAAGQSGFAFFLNASSALANLPVPFAVNEKASVRSPEAKIVFSQSGSSSDGVRLQRRIQQLQEARAKLRVK